MALCARAQQQSHFKGTKEPHFTRVDSLRGSITRERAWWDVVSYDLQVNVTPSDSTFSGSNTITYKVLKADSVMQIDLQYPMAIDSVAMDIDSLKISTKTKLEFERDSNVWYIRMRKSEKIGTEKKVTIFYHGKPKVAVNAPWDGGVVWTKDSLGRTWVATACQGLGASVWWPNKDHQSDEPQYMTISVTVPQDLVDVSNGRLKIKFPNKEDNTVTYVWYVSNPINNYDVALNIGHYKEIKDTYNGEGGKLDLDYWVLDYNVERAKKHFEVVKPMLKCFEYWFGKYPFYKDSYKLVDAPHLGMEHQSAVAYGNGYQMGYKGRDLSGTGQGLKWDFIIVHESGHEWFGNNITTRDIADMWVHEGFTNYSETLFTECQYGEEAGNEYQMGTRKNIKNDIPIIGHYGVNNEGSGDMYYKGATLVHMIRQIIDDDEAFRQLLRDMNRDFGGLTISSAEVEQYIMDKTGKDLRKTFDQYLRDTTLPELQYRIVGQVLYFRWSSDIQNFDMPVKVTVGIDNFQFIHPGPRWATANLSYMDPKYFKVDKKFYIKVKEMKTVKEMKDALKK
ncbi:M1 family metallopeptidase [Chitinophaga agrisoli]|nr:M1 family metallopeptidase [Chitinophaga agrisoli]